MRYSKQEIEASREYLRKLLKPGDTLHTILRHVSRSGMSRDIDVIFTNESHNANLSWDISRALDYSQAKDGSIKVGGCGMDMGFSVVYDLSNTLFGEYKCLGEKCPSPDHTNSRGWGEDKLPPYKRDGKMEHKDGYAISQRWL